MDCFTTRISQHIGSEIKKRRKAQGISGSELANQLQISQQQISRYERGINQPSIVMIIRLLSHLKASDAEMKNFLESVITAYQTQLPYHTHEKNEEQINKDTILSAISAEEAYPLKTTCSTP